MADFMQMGGYGAYVWPAFGVAAVVMVGLLIASLRRLRINEAALRELEASGVRPRRRPRRGEDEA